MRDYVPICLTPATPQRPNSLLSQSLRKLCVFIHSLLEDATSETGISKYLEGLPSSIRDDLLKDVEDYVAEIKRRESKPVGIDRLKLSNFRSIFSLSRTTELELYSVVMMGPEPNQPQELDYLNALMPRSLSTQKLKFIEERLNSQPGSTLNLERLTLCSSVADASRRAQLILSYNVCALDLVETLLKKCPKLERLCLLELCTDGLLHAIGTHCRALKFLKVENMGPIVNPSDNRDLLTDEGIVDLVASSPQLRVLDLSEVASNSNEMLNRVTGHALVNISQKLHHLLELRLRLSHFTFCKLSSNGLDEPLTGSTTVQNVYVKVPWDMDFSLMCVHLKEMAEYLLEFFPRMTALSLDGIMFPDVDSGDEVEKSLLRLPRELIKSANLDGCGSESTLLFAAAEQLYIENPRRDFILAPNTFMHLRRFIMDKESFSLPFSSVVSIMVNSPLLRELLIRSPHITGASDQALAAAFNSNPELSNLSIFYLCSHETDMELTDASLKLVLERCGNSLTRLGYIQTWKLLDKSREEYCYGGKMFRAVKALQGQKYFTWGGELEGKNELAEMSKFFYNKK